MITAPVVSLGDFKQVTPNPRVCVDPPTNDPFAAAARASLSQLDSGATVLLEAACAPPPPSLTSGEILERLVWEARQRAERYPDSPRAYTNLGLALCSANQIEKATEAFKHALDLEPSSYVAGLTLARILVNQRQLERAEELYQGLLKASPNDPALNTSLADVFMRRGQFDRAEDRLREIIAHNENAILPRYQLAIALLRLNRVREALAHLRSAVRSDPRSPVLHHALGVTYAIQGNSTRAVRSFKTALALCPGMRESTFGIVQILLQRHMPDEAIGYLEEYLQGENAKDSQGKELLGRAYLQMRRYAAARSQLKEILATLEGDEEPTTRERSRLLNNIAVCHALGGERQRAVELLEAAIRLCPTCNVTPYRNLSRIHLELGEEGKVLEVLAVSKRSFPEDQETRLLRAAAFEMLDLNEQSLQELEELGALKDAGPAAYAALGGRLVDLRNDLGRGIAVLKEGHEKFPRDAVLINNLAYALLMKGDVVEARQILELAPRKKERWSVFLTATWGLLRLKEGDVLGGANLYQEAEELASQIGNKRLACAVRQKMHLELARLYLQRKNYEGAWHEVQVGLKEKDGSKLYRSSLEETARETRARWGFLDLPDGS